MRNWWCSDLRRRGLRRAGARQAPFCRRGSARPAGAGACGAGTPSSAPPRRRRSCGSTPTRGSTPTMSPAGIRNPPSGTHPQNILFPHADIDLQRPNECFKSFSFQIIQVITQFSIKQFKAFPYCLTIFHYANQVSLFSFFYPRGFQLRFFPFSHDFSSLKKGIFY